MRLFGLIGFPLQHSFSQKFFTEKFTKEQIQEADYRLFPIESIKDLNALIHEQKPLGLNVTIPYKIEVLPYLDAMDGEAQQIGAVNCIKISYVDGKPFCKGYNTDLFGFEESLKPLLPKHSIKALVLGNGGAALAVKFVLRKLNIEFAVVTRREDEFLSFEDIDTQLLNQHQLIINTTPLGTFPKVDACPPIAYEELSPQHILYDLVYNPAETLFLKKGKEKSCIIKNGLEMLILQAEKSWEIWNQQN